MNAEMLKTRKEKNTRNVLGNQINVFTFPSAHFLFSFSPMENISTVKREGEIGKKIQK